MPVLAAYMVPNPPMIVPEVGCGDERQVEATRAAYERVAQDIADLKPETVIILSYFQDSCFVKFQYAVADGQRCLSVGYDS